MKHCDMPKWVLKQRKKGTEILVRGDNFYLCRVTSVWDPKLGRAKKATGEYLGKITKEGIVPPKHKRVEELGKQASVKEYGATGFLDSVSEDVRENLKIFFPYEWKTLYALSVLRLVEKTPLKRFELAYHTSYISEEFPGLNLSAKYLGPFLREIGCRREAMTGFMKTFLSGSEHAAIDLTEIFTFSPTVNSAAVDYNGKNTHVPQINLALIFSLDKMLPGFFRMIPEGVRDVSVIKKTVEELGLENTVFLGDKGFESAGNVEALNKSHLPYILPLKRNNSLIDYGRVKKGERSSFDGVFLFGKRHVWHYSSEKEGEKIIIFLDEKLKAEETRCLLLARERLKKSLEKEKDPVAKEDLEKSIKEYESKIYGEDYALGTITVRTNCNKTAEEVYGLLKSRAGIEKAFDIFKNTLRADKSYMRDEQQLEGFLFMSFIALLLYYLNLSFASVVCCFGL